MNDRKYKYLVSLVETSIIHSKAVNYTHTYIRNVSRPFELL